MPEPIKIYVNHRGSQICFKCDKVPCTIAKERLMLIVDLSYAFKVWELETGNLILQGKVEPPTKIIEVDRRLVKWLLE
jgi:hypothetical protein